MAKPLIETMVPTVPKYTLKAFILVATPVTYLHQRSIVILVAHQSVGEIYFSNSHFSHNAPSNAGSSNPAN